MKTIGHTSSGKPVYAAFQLHKSFSDWTANDHHDAAEVHRSAARTDIKTNVSMHKNSAALHEAEAQRIYKLVGKLGLASRPGASKRQHATKKSRAQLDREIAEALSRKRSGQARPSARSAHATKADFDWSSFTDGAAFGFWASPYMTEVQALADESREAYRALAPSPGGKWDDVMPEAPPSAYAVAKKFTKAVRDQLTDDHLDEIASKYSAHDAGYYGAMQSQGEGVGWFDRGVRVDPPRGFEWDPKLTNAIDRAIAKGLREAGVKRPRR